MNQRPAGTVIAGSARPLRPGNVPGRAWRSVHDSFRERAGRASGRYGIRPWRLVSFNRPQILGGSGWATRDTLPVRIREVLPVAPLVRLSPDRTRGAVLLLPSGLDPIREMTVEVRAPMTPVCLASPGRTATALQPRKEKQGWSGIIRDIESWRALALFLG